MNTYKKQLKGGFEYDLLTKWRKYCEPKAKTLRWVKQHYIRRIRRTEKIQLRDTTFNQY